MVFLRQFSNLFSGFKGFSLSTVVVLNVFVFVLKTTNAFILFYFYLEVISLENHTNFYTTRQLFHLKEQVYAS